MSKEDNKLTDLFFKMEDIIHESRLHLINGDIESLLETKKLLDENDELFKDLRTRIKKHKKELKKNIKTK